MNVKELIEILKNKDPDLVCLVDGYEGGMEFLDAEKIEIIKFFECEYHLSYTGHIEECDQYSLDHPEYYPECIDAKTGIVFHR